MKLLFLIPIRSSKGGITEYYNIFEKYVSSDLQYSFFERGNRSYPQKSYLSYLLYTIYDFIRYVFKVITKNQIVVINISLLSKISLIRDTSFLILGKFFGRKVVMFYHGWDDDFVEQNRKGYWFNQLFRADSAIVIREAVKQTLIEIGYSNPIYHTITMVDNELIKGYSFEEIKQQRTQRTSINLLFLARVEKAKGIYELIDAFQIIQNENDNIFLTIAGDGLELNNAKQIVKSKGLKNVSFIGFVQGQDKINAFCNSSIYVFPSYTEGMPTSVLEAISFGIPVITTDVGGLPDFFENGKHGFFIPVKDRFNIVDRIKELYDKNLRDTISEYNYNYGKERFLATAVMIKNEKILRDIASK
jgi:glycosyltransferase involved in cell wall biosynthesis